MAKKQDKLPGSLYQRNGRWWWRVKLPGEEIFKARPLIPLGSKYAYINHRLAELCSNRRR